jgi:hypothetical protein
VTARPPDELLDRVERLLGSRPVAWHHRAGGWTTNERWSLDLADGRRAFAKMAPVSDMAGFLRQEHANLTRFEADFGCAVLGWDDHPERPLLMLEDLRDGRWPPPWEPGDVERVRTTLEAIWSLPAADLPPADRQSDMFRGWSKIAANPGGFLSLGLATRDWLEACVERLVEVERSIVYAGDDFIHMDVRSDNICFAGDRVVFVDWNWAVRGRRDLDLACWLPSLRLEGGPLPEEVEPGLGDYAAAISGFFASYASTPPPPTAPHVRRFQLRQLRISLPWACRELGLPQPDVRWAMDEIARVDADLDGGRIDEAEWHRRIEEPLIDAYLASDDPRGQSGKGGDETDWRWARGLILDVFPPRATFLDVGCANGYLMESVHRWGRERGIDVEPYGLDISWRIAALARHRLPHWRDRIFVGNAFDWEPPIRFDVVQIGVDEVPVGKRRELVERVLRDYLVPGGTLISRANRANVAPELRLESLGFRPDGVVESVHPRTGDVRRAEWLTAPDEHR